MLIQIVLWSLAIALVGGYFVTRAMTSQPDPVEPDLPEPVELPPLTPMYDLPDWTLTDHNGEAFSSADLAGKPWVGFLFLTNCPAGICPAMMGKMGEFSRAVGELPVDIVGFSIDPERDTPETRAEYVRSVAGEEPDDRWHIVTGESPDDMVDLAQRMRLVANPDDNWGHSSYFLLVDGEGTVRGIYRNSDDTMVEQLGRDAEMLVEKMGLTPKGE